ncbi:MAG: cupin domain-containing protein, partial [Nitrospinaceae bacterium]|nr:cupin domain-containing protein [Nitrospinaceae bacterium]
MPFHRWDDMKPRNLVKTTDSEGNLILGELTTVTRQIQPPGKATRPHTHGCEQMIQILEGAGWFRVGDEEKTVGPGEVVHIPMGALHELKNEGEDRL